MTDYATLGDDDLRRAKADLVHSLAGASGDDRAALDAEIEAIEREEERRALQAGRDAAAIVDDAAARLEEVRTRRRHDAASALRRQAKRL